MSAPAEPRGLGLRAAPPQRPRGLGLTLGLGPEGLQTSNFAAKGEGVALIRFFADRFRQRV